MKCVACHEWLQHSLDGVVADRTDVDRHVRACAECRATLEAADRLRAGLPRLVTPAPTVAFAARLVAAVKQDRHRRLRRVRLAWGAGLAVAASVLVAVSLRFWPERQAGPTLPEITNNQTPPRPEDTPGPAKEQASPTVESTVASVASLTSRTTTQAVEQTASLLPRVVEPAWPELPLQPSLPSTTLSLREAGHGVSEGFAPMANHARRAVGLLRRDLMSGETMKPEM